MGGPGATGRNCRGDRNLLALNSERIAAACCGELQSLRHATLIQEKSLTCKVYEYKFRHYIMADEGFECE